MLSMNTTNETKKMKFAEKKLREQEELIKSKLMWNLGRKKQIEIDLSNGIGLAILSKVIGITDI